MKNNVLSERASLHKIERKSESKQDFKKTLQT